MKATIFALTLLAATASHAHEQDAQRINVLVDVATTTQHQLGELENMIQICQSMTEKNTAIIEELVNLTQMQEQRTRLTEKKIDNLNQQLKIVHNNLGLL